MKKIIVLSFAVIAIALGFAFFATPVGATVGAACNMKIDTTHTTIIPCSDTAKEFCNSSRLCEARNTDTYGLNNIENSIDLGNKPLTQSVASLINVALGLLGIVAVVIVLVGGFKWMTAGGNDEKTGEARKWIFSGVIGLAIIMSAWAITRFVFIQLQKATGSGQTGVVTEQGL